MKGNNICFAKRAAWGAVKCIFLQCMQSASQILGCSGQTDQIADSRGEFI